MSDYPPSPPSAPSIRRRLVIRRSHAVGQGALVLVAILALLGVFGVTRDTVDAAGGPVALEVAYPERTRYKLLDTMTFRVLADAPLSDVTLAVSAPYLAGFSNVTFEPEPARITPEVYLVPLGDAEPGTPLVATAEVQAERYWLHAGWVEVRSDDEVLARVDVSTFIFP